MLSPSRLFLHRFSVLLLVVCLVLACASLLTPATAKFIITAQPIALDVGCEEHAADYLERSRFRPVDAFMRSQCNESAMPSGLQSAPFVARSDGVQFYYYGSRNLPELVLLDGGGAQYRFKTHLIENRISFHNLYIPEFLQGQTLTLQLSSYNDANAGQWIAIAGLQNASFSSYVVLGYLSLLSTLIAVSALLFGLHAFIRLYFEQDESLIVMPLLLGAFGFAAFWGYFIHYALGVLISATALVVVTVGAWRRLQQTNLPVQTLQLEWSTAALILVCAFSLFGLTISYFPYTFGLAEDFQQVAHRWREMPVDSYLPKLLADRIWVNQAINPFISGWLSSDRPPLQSGINLLFYPVLQNGMAYQGLSALLQATMILPMLLIVRQLGLSRVLFWVLLGLMSCGFIILNSVYVWPKLLAATYLLICYLLVFDSDRLEFSPPLKILLIAVAGSSAMLCHGGSVFALLPIFLIALGRGFKYCLTVLVPSGLLMIVCYLPWVFYQRVIDPPGDRLLKWHFAGHPAITDSSFGETLINAYSSLTLNQWVANHWANIERVFDRAWQIIYWIPELFKIPFHAPHYGFLHDITFGNFFFSFWFLSPLYALMAYALSGASNSNVKAEERETLKSLLQVSVLGLCIWILLMFRPGSTSNHLGTYFIWLSCFLVAVTLAARTHKFYLIIAVVLNALLMLQFYVFDYVWFARPANALYLVYSLVTFLLLLVSIWWVQSAVNRQTNAIKVAVTDRG